MSAVPNYQGVCLPDGSGARHTGSVEVRGSNPLCSTKKSECICTRIFSLLYSFYFPDLFLYILPIMRSAAIVNNTTRQGKSIHNVRRAPLCITDSSPKTKYITNSKIITAATAMQRTKILAVLFFIKSPSFQINKCYHSALPLCSFL